MSLLFRMLYVYIISFFREPLAISVPTISRLNLITLPNDLDVNLHVNNGRYLTLCDLNRVDIFIRTGLLKVMRKNRWIPIVAEHTMTYKKPLRVFQRFEVTAEITHWDEKIFYMKHQFFSKGKLVAEGTSKGVVKGREGVIPPEEVVRQVALLRAAKQA